MSAGGVVQVAGLLRRVEPSQLSLEVLRQITRLAAKAVLLRRLRSRLVDQQKSKRNLYRKLIKRDVPRRQAARAVFSNKARWALSNTFVVTRAYPVGWFVGEMGQAIRSNKQLPRWFDVDRWIRLA